jgi:hypothetical protein
VQSRTHLSSVADQEASPKQAQVVSVSVPSVLWKGSGPQFNLHFFSVALQSALPRQIHWLASWLPYGLTSGSFSFVQSRTHLSSVADQEASPKQAQVVSVSVPSVLWKGSGPQFNLHFFSVALQSALPRQIH